jgi:predicted transcriptional regulator of viral defense system
MLSTYKKFPTALKKGPFSVADAQMHGVNRLKLFRLVQHGYLERIERGIYRVCAEDIDDEEAFRSATLRVGPDSAICLLSALSYYHLSDEIPHQIWLMVEQQKRTIHRDLRVIRVLHPNWNIGIETHKGYKITSIERTLVEAIIGRRYLGPMLGIESLKLALIEKKTTLAKVIDMASKLGFLNRIKHVIEVLV